MLRATNAAYTITLDQDPETQSAIARATGQDTKWFATSDLLDAAGDLAPTAVFLDVGICAEHGQIIRRLKDNYPLAPLILTSPEAESDRLTEAMALGADDFLVKPFDGHDLARRLAVRCAALAKRAARETLVVGDMVIDTLQRTVTTDRGQKALSPTEVRLVSELAKADGAVVPREILKTRCWSAKEQVTDNALNRKLYEIRRRLKPLSDRVRIRTIYGVGFVMERK